MVLHAWKRIWKGLEMKEKDGVKREVEEGLEEEGEVGIYIV